jgi:Helix-turn-helix domain
MVDIIRVSGTYRQKIFNKDFGRQLDRNAKIRIAIFAKGYSARHKRPGQHQGPLTRATLEVLNVLLYSFHNGQTGQCFPGYDAIAKAAGCCRDTVWRAIKALEAANILTWAHRLIRVRCQEPNRLTGRLEWVSRLARTSNAYTFRDPAAGAPAPHNQAIRAHLFGLPSKSENQPGTILQDSMIGARRPVGAKIRAGDGLEAALARFGAALGV